MKQQYIIMADMIGSSTIQDKNLMKNFKKLITEINRIYANVLLSPLTITLGDEFQGVCKSLKKSTEIIVSIEEKIIDYGFNFKLRYIINYGEITTPINKSIAYEMLGKGLTDARTMITQMKKLKDERFAVYTDDGNTAEALTKTFYLFQSIVDQWKPQDYELVSSFIREKDYKIVAEELSKDVSLMWRREKSLQIKEYTYIKDLIIYLSEK
jgi:hypothetical protein